jgi:hypothetical protein
MKTETNAERLLMTNIIKASPGEDYESIEDELLKVQNDPAHLIVVNSIFQPTKHRYPSYPV